jgi:hypothetical protein
MKTPVIFLGLILLLSGCTTTGFKPEQAQLVAAITQPVTQTLVLPLLQRHPEYEPALLAMAAGIDVVFAQGQVDATMLRGYVEALSVKFKLAEADKLAIALGISNLYNFYVATYQKPVMDAADPNVKAIVAAFKTGVVDGIKFYHAYNAAPAVPAAWAPAL